MANFTEQAIMKTFVEMLSEQPLDKITVRALAQRCGISRNTFYYHFHDIYELLEVLFETEEERLLANAADAESLRAGLMEATRFAIENITAIRHVYESANYNQLLAYLYSAAEICVRPYIEAQAEGLDVSHDDVEGMIFLGSSMIQGVVLNTLRTNVPRNAEEMVGRACRMLEGTIRFTLENASKHIE